MAFACLYRIVRGIVMFISQILERILGDELIMDITGGLEYDPEVSCIRHRIFLKDHVVFKEAIPIKHPQVLSKIHQTYRVRYLKIITMLKDDSTFIKELFAQLKAPTNSAESKKKLVNANSSMFSSIVFLYTFCAICYFEKFIFLPYA